MDDETTAAGLATVDPGFTHLWQRAQAVLGADERVRSVHIGGSVSGGDADRWSDLDLVVVSEPDHHDAFLADWPDWLAAITPTVFAQTPIAPFIINTVTDAGLTLDISVWPGEAPVFPAPAPVYRVGMLSGTAFDDLGAALEYAVLEQLRGMNGPFVSLIQRDEHLRHLTGVPHLLGLLTTVFLAETGELPPGKRWNAAYTDEQLAVAAALPPVTATRDSLIAFGMAVAEQVVTRARPLFERYGREWPADLARVTAARVRDQLGIDAGAWLY